MSLTQVASFGSFELFVRQRLLLENGNPVPLGSRALAILTLLIENAGKIVPKYTLIDHVWEGVVVEETSLRVHIGALRKALRDGMDGARYISNVPGRGYSFVGSIRFREDLPSESNQPVASAPIPGNLPSQLTRIVGRDDLLRSLVEQQSRRRLLTITGPGGIGKTTMALAVARTVGANYPDGVLFVDLSPVSGPGFVAGTLAAALDVALHPQDPVAALITALRDKQMLLLLDSCEHVIDAAAELVAKLLRFTERLSILVTSREALRAEGEWVQRMPSLAFPQPGVTPTAEEALRFAAVQLFVERAAESLGGYTLTNSDAPLVADLCRKLDGIALAIELAAGRTNNISVRDLASQIDDRFRLLKHGRRTAVPRHQTLRATLDWSYDSLPPVEQRLLKRLAIFSGAFTSTAVVSVCALAPIAAEDVPDCLADLLAKSLITVTLDEPEASYRLLETTRSYASEKLTASDELSILAQRHAHYVLSVFESAANERETQPTKDWLARYSPEIPNLRAALKWAFSDQGDPALGVRLVIVAVPIWSQLSLLDESLDWVERALAASSELPDQDQRRQMQLYCALGGLQMYAIVSVRKATDAWGTALQLAIELGDVDYELRALRALWAEAINAGEFRRALQLAERFRERANTATATADQAIADRLVATALHFLGEQSPAWQATVRMLSHYSSSTSSSHIVRYQFNQEATARAIRARILWVWGRPDSALKDLEDTIANVVAIDHTLTLVHVLTVAACPIALLVGDLEAARRYTQRLRALTEPRTLDIFYSYCLCFDAELEIRSGKVEDGLRSLDAPMRELRQSGFNHALAFFLMARARGLLAAHREPEAATSIAEAISICERTGEAWCLPELLRLQGEITLAQRSPRGTDTAIGLFNRALSLARDQQALAWELRAAGSLVRCMNADDLRLKGARSVLREVMEKFAEGRDQPDFVAAASLLGPTTRP